MCNTDTCDCELSLDFEILAFPCNQFRGQEPGSSEEIQNVVCTRFKAEFPVFDKVITVIYCKFFVTYLTFDTLCMEMVLFGLDVLGNFPSQILYAFFFFAMNSARIQHNINIYASLYGNHFNISNYYRLKSMGRMQNHFTSF